MHNKKNMFPLPSMSCNVALSSNLLCRLQEANNWERCLFKHCLQGSLRIIYFFFLKALTLEKVFNYVISMSRISVTAQRKNHGRLFISIISVLNKLLSNLSFNLICPLPFPLFTLRSFLRMIFTLSPSIVILTKNCHLYRNAFAQNFQSL